MTLEVGKTYLTKAGYTVRLISDCGPNEDAPIVGYDIKCPSGYMNYRLAGEREDGDKAHDNLVAEYREPIQRFTVIHKSDFGPRNDFASNILYETEEEAEAGNGPNVEVVPVTISLPPIPLIFENEEEELKRA